VRFFCLFFRFRTPCDPFIDVAAPPPVPGLFGAAPAFSAFSARIYTDGTSLRYERTSDFLHGYMKTITGMPTPAFWASKRRFAHSHASCLQFCVKRWGNHPPPLDPATSAAERPVFVHLASFPFPPIFFASGSSHRTFSSVVFRSAEALQNTLFFFAASSSLCFFFSDHTLFVLPSYSSGTPCCGPPCFGGTPPRTTSPPPLVLARSLNP